MVLHTKSEANRKNRKMTRSKGSRKTDRLARAVSSNICLLYKSVCFSTALSVSAMEAKPTGSG